MRTFKLILTYVTLPIIGIVLGWLIRSCQDEQGCSTMFWAQGSHMECPK